MKVYYFLLACFLTGLTPAAFAQCPPTGFPQPGNTCPLAPILCENLDGYCATINNNNTTQTFPGCPGWQLNNDEWFAFFAGSTSITIQVTPSNCSSGGMQGLQGGIYDGCGPPWDDMDLQCSCTTNPFILTSNNFVIGQIYYFVLDGCAGNVCDYSIDVLSGSTVGVPPDDPGAISGPTNVCAGASTSFSISTVTAATIYNWTLNPASAGTVSANANNVTINWSNTASGSVELCVSVANLCYSNPDSSCLAIDVTPRPTAVISGSGNLCANTPGSVDLTVNFTGDAPWTFVYTINGVAQPPIQTSENPYTLQATQPGVYALQSVTSPAGSNNCPGTVSGSATITLTTLNSTTAVTNAQCGQSNGAINLTPAGGTTPYSFNWSNGETTEDLANIPPGTYTVTVTSANGCTQSVTATVQDNQITINISGTVVNNTTCTGGNGSITTTITPSGSYTFEWSNGLTNQNLNNLEPGSYTLTVTSGVNCTASMTFTVDDNPNEPNITFSTVQSTCDLSNGSINISVSGGVSPYTFSWSNGATTEDLANIPAGAYGVTVTGANGCTDSADITVDNNNPPININANIAPNTTCIGGNGSISISITPAGSYTIGWSNGATTANIANLPPGTYTVTVSAGGSCTETAEFTIDDEPNEPNISFSVVQTTCDLSNGSINLSVSGGVPPYAFLWSNGALTEDLNNIPAGNYAVTVTGANGCSNSADITVDNNNPSININGNLAANTTCIGGNGSIALSVTPAGAYTYLWSTGAITPNIINLPPGTYTVTVSGGGSCTETAQFTIDDNPFVPNITFTFVETTCDLSNGSINAIVTGGVPPYTYLWSNNATTSGLNNIPAGNYAVTVTGANGCSHTADIDLPNNNPPINIGANIAVNTACLSGTGNGSISLFVTPAGAYTYVWSTGSTASSINNLAPGIYEVTVSGGGSCTETASFVVPDDPNVPELSFSQTDPTCGLSNGSINLTVVGGVAPYTYTWSGGQTTQDINNLPPDIYIVTVTGANGCSAIDGVVLSNMDIPVSVSGDVTQKTSCVTNNGSITLALDPPNLTINWSNGSHQPVLNNLAPGVYTVTVSAGGSCTETAEFTIFDASEPPILLAEITSATCGFSNGAIDLEAYAGIDPYTYHWSNNAATQDLNNLPAGSYAVTVTSAVGCTATLYADVPAETITIEISGTVSDNISCDDPNGYIDIDLYPAPANYVYHWSTNATTQDIYDIPGGTYTVSVTLGTGCSAQATFDVLDNTDPPNLSTSATPALCGQSNGSASVSASGGSSPYTFKWSNNASTPSINNLASGTYTVTVTDFFGCSASASVTVPTNTIAVNISGVSAPNTSCSAANGSINIAATPAATFTYIWSNAAVTEDLNNVPAGAYTVTVSAGAGCSATASFSVANNTIDPVIAAAVTASICGLNNGAIDLTVSNGTPNYSFAWSNSAVTEDLSNILSGIYTVTVTDANGCTADTTLNVANNATTFSLTGASLALTSCTAANGSIDLTVTPAGAYTFQWSNSATTEDIANLPAGAYTVSVTETGSCTASASFIVADGLLYPALNQTITAELCGLSDGSVDLEVSGGFPPFTYQWGGGQMTQDLINVPAGSYSATVTGANGCTAATTAAVPASAINFSISGTPVANTSCLQSNGNIDISLSPANPGAGPGYSFSWSNTATTEDLNGIPAGAYTVTVSAGGTCTNVASYTVPNDAVPPAVSENTGAALCGQSSGSINLTISGGIPPYTFLWSNTAQTEDLSGLPSGTYTVTVTGANGCSTTKAFVVLENVVTPAISGIPAANTSCVSNNGLVNLSVSPNTLTYSFAWSGGQTTQNISNLAPGDYTVTVNGGGSCTNTAIFTVANNTLTPILADSVSPALCGQASGSISLAVSGGFSPYTFLWSNMATIEDLSGVVSGNYAVTVSGVNGCTAAAAYTIPEDVILPNIAGTPTPNSSCITANGAIVLAVTPATLAYTYAWAGGQNTPDLSDLAPGSYTVTVNGGGACIATAVFTVSDATGTVSLSGATTDVLCFGQNTGAIDLSAGGGAAPYTFSWLPGIPGNPEDPAGLPAGNYTVLATDMAGCTATASFTVGQPAAAVQLVCSQSSNVSFPGATDGAAAIDISGGVAPYSVVWSPGTSQANLGAGVFSIGNLGVDNYAVTVTDANGCPAVCAFTISIIKCETALGTMPGNLQALCGDGCQSANYNPAGQYLEPGDVLQFILHEGAGAQIVNEIARNNLPSFCFDPTLMNYGTVYYISAAAGNNDGAGNVLLSHFCTVVAPGTPVVFYDIPVAGVVPPGPLNCVVDEVSLPGSSSLPGASFQWSTSGGQIIGNPAQAVIRAGAGGSYTLIVASNGCADTLTVTVADYTNQPEAEVLASPDDILDCTINQIILSGDIKGTMDANAVWYYNGNTFAVGAVLTIDAPGVYTFIIQDTVSFCSDTAVIQIDENLAYPPLFTNPPGALNCINPAVHLSGGSPLPGIQFSWALVNGPDTTVIGAGAFVTVSSPGNYILIGVDPANACTNALGVQVNADLTAPSADAGTPFSIDCYGETAFLDASASSGLPGFTLQWSTTDGSLVAGSATPTPEINEPGTYTLLVTNPGNGCTDTDVVVIAPEEPAATVDVRHPPCVGDKGIILIDTVIGAKPPLRYSLNNGQSFTAQNFFANLNPGDYTILVRDANGCETTVQATVNEPQVFEITLEPRVTIHLGESYQIETTVNLPASALSQILWTPATGLDCDTCLNPLAIPLITTQYRVTVFSNAGCKDDAALLLIVDRRPDVYIPNIFSPNDDGENDVFRIYADPKSVKQVKSFQVFTRWGELVYEYFNFDPNSPAYGWNGTHRGQPLNPGVFAYYAVIEFIDGQEILYEGDVTLIR